MPLAQTGSCEMAFDLASDCYVGLTAEGQHHVYVPALVFHHAHTDQQEEHISLASCDPGWWVDRSYDAPGLGIRVERISDFGPGKKDGS
jgi:hypothetical protein